MKLPQPRRYNDKMKWESAIAEGENAKGFTSQTVNGTGHAFGTGWNQCACDYESPQGDPTPISPKGRSNRTAE